jgi:hydroxycarboxylate dehydrogenase B
VAYLSGKTRAGGRFDRRAGQADHRSGGDVRRPAGGADHRSGMHKGFGLALLGDILGGSFSGGGAYLPERQVPSRIINNMMAILIDPDAFRHGGGNSMLDMDRYAAWVKASPPAPGVAAVQFPGDPERSAAPKSGSAHGIPVDPGTWGQLLETAKAVGVPDDVLARFAAV